MGSPQALESRVRRPRTCAALTAAVRAVAEGTVEEMRQTATSFDRVVRPIFKRRSYLVSRALKRMVTILVVVQYGENSDNEDESQKQRTEQLNRHTVDRWFQCKISRLQRRSQTEIYRNSHSVLLEASENRTAMERHRIYFGSMVLLRAEEQRVIERATEDKNL